MRCDLIGHGHSASNRTRDDIPYVYDCRDLKADVYRRHFLVVVLRFRSLGNWLSLALQPVAQFLGQAQYGSVSPLLSKHLITR